MTDSLKAAHNLAESRAVRRKEWMERQADELREAQAKAWDKAIEEAAKLIGKGDDGYDWSKYEGEKAIRDLVNPYRSKTYD